MSKARDVADSYTDVEVDAKDATLQTQVNDKVGTTSNQALHSTDALRISGSTLYLYKGNGGNESVALPSSAPTSAQVGSATAGLSGGAIGTYTFAMRATLSDVVLGGTVAGSDLRMTSAEQRAETDWSVSGFATSSGLVGTWRCMARYDARTGGSSDERFGATLWMRIS